jgi:hypothetical protein
MWCTLAEGAESTLAPVIELHFNFWRQIGKDQDYLDIGLMLSNAGATGSACIYLPFRIKDSDVTDLSPMLKEAAIATGIFNTHLTAANSSDNNSSISLSDSTTGKFFAVVHSFASNGNTLDESELKVKECNGGSIIEITRAAIARASKGLETDQPSYYRIRLRLTGAASCAFVKTITPTDKTLLSGFDSTEYIDFRLNQARNLPDQIQRIMADAWRGSTPNFKRVDFLLVMGVAADLVGGHEIQKHRLLEADLWKNYLGRGDSNVLPEGMVIYHWRKKAEDGGSVDDFNAFVKFRFRKSDAHTVKSYMVAAFFIGAIGSLLATGLLACLEALLPSLAVSYSCAQLPPEENELLSKRLNLLSATSSAMTGIICIRGEN